jgi:hypothetical protein
MILESRLRLSQPDPQSGPRKFMGQFQRPGGDHGSVQKAFDLRFDPGSRAADSPLGSGLRRGSRCDVLQFALRQLIGGGRVDTRRCLCVVLRLKLPTSQVPRAKTPESDSL